MIRKFSDLYFYDKDKIERYTMYQKSYPQLSFDEVVWHVNAKLDLAPYTEIEATNLEQFPLILNKYYALPASYVPKNSINFPQSSYRACEEVVHAFLSLASDAKKKI